MEIPKRMLDRWKVLKSPEDGKLLTERFKSFHPDTNAHPEYFRRALVQGKCNDRVFEVMAAFYSEKANLIKEYL